ncbi:MAG: hypothetical protein ACK4MM_06645, partial [Fervidobacterium sp.]
SPPAVVRMGDPFTITVEVLNCGSTKLEKIIEEVGIADSELIYKTHANITTFYDVNPSERKLFVYSWAPFGSPGINYLFLKTYFGNAYKQHNFSFVVLERPEIPAEKAPIPSGIEGGFAPGPNMVLNYTRRINRTQDSSYLLLIKVLNLGDVDLHDIYLKLSSLDLKTRIIYPDRVDVLPPGESVIFITEITAPLETPPGEYTIELDAFSREMTKNYIINVNVEVMSLREKIKDLIQYYSDVIKQLDKEIEQIQDEKNVTLAKQLLDESKAELETAKDFYKLGWLQDALEQIEKVKDKINQVVMALAKAESLPKKRITLPALPINYLLLLFLIIILSVVSYLVFKKLRERNKLIYFKRWNF